MKRHRRQQQKSNANVAGSKNINIHTLKHHSKYWIKIRSNQVINTKKEKGDKNDSRKKFHDIKYVFH